MVFQVLALGSSSYLDLNSNFMPDQRFLYFAVTGPCTVKVWFKTSSTGNTRSAILDKWS